jgi:hypothetical protein
MAVREKSKRKRNELPVEILFSMPWQISAGIGTALLFGLKWLLPAMSAGNMFLNNVHCVLSSPCINRFIEASPLKIFE